MSHSELRNGGYIPPSSHDIHPKNLRSKMKKIAMQKSFRYIMWLPKSKNVDATRSEIVKKSEMTGLKLLNCRGIFPQE
jgi:hypothetical protein